MTVVSCKVVPTRESRVVLLNLCDVEKIFETIECTVLMNLLWLSISMDCFLTPFCFRRYWWSVFLTTPSVNEHHDVKFVLLLFPQLQLTSEMIAKKTRLSFGRLFSKLNSSSFSFPWLRTWSNRWKCWEMSRKLDNIAMNLEVSSNEKDYSVDQQREIRPGWNREAFEQQWINPISIGEQSSSREQIEEGGFLVCRNEFLPLCNGSYIYIFTLFQGSLVTLSTKQNWQEREEGSEWVEETILIRCSTNALFDFMGSFVVRIRSWVFVD